MAFRVHETSIDGYHAERHIEAHILVVPGVTIPTGNHARRHPGELVRDEAPGLTRGKLEQTVAIIQRQASIWRSFEVEADHRRITYRFTFKVEATQDERLVRDVPPAAQGSDVADDDGEARGYRDVMGEVRMFENVAVVHPWFSDNPASRLITHTGDVLRTNLEGRLLTHPCNLMRLPHSELTSSVNLTAAHEIGHLLGLGHQRAQDDATGGTFIMQGASSADRAVRRSDQLNLHAAVETFDVSRGVLRTGMRGTPHPPGMRRSRARLVR